MNDLHKALQRIQEWLETYRLTYFTSLNPGLTRNEIAKKVSSLPFQLSEEVYTLYEWHNGTDSSEEFFPGFCFPPLEDVIADVYYPKSEFGRCTLPEEIDNYFLLPIFSYDFSSISTLEIDARRDCSFVLRRVIPEEPSAIYSINLTRMMEIIAECFASGAYYMRASNSGGSELWWNYKTESEIHRAHNRELSEFILEKIHHAKREMSSEIMVKLYYLIEWFGDSRSVEPLIELLQMPSQDGLDPDELALIQDVAAYGLGKLNDFRAVEPLIDALSSNYKIVRYRASKMLGELGDNRAIPFLITALTDTDEGTRNNCQYSLIELGAVNELLANAIETKNEYAIMALGLLPSSTNKRGLTLEQKDRILSVLTTLINDTSPSVQDIARVSLDRARRELLEEAYES